MVSGIGPRTTLEQLSISVLSDRPGVGQNMFVSDFAMKTQALAADLTRTMFPLVQCIQPTW